VSETVNPKLDAVEKFFKDTIGAAAVDALLVALFSQAPYLAVWPLKQFISSVIRMIANALFGKLKLMIDFGAIVLINEQHRREYTTAIVSLRAIADTHGIDSKEFKDAREIAKNRLRDLVRFLG